MPTLKVSEYTVLQIVGLDAAVVRQLERTLHFTILFYLPASQLLQDVLLPLLPLLRFCSLCAHAHQPQGQH